MVFTNALTCDFQGERELSLKVENGIIKQIAQDLDSLEIGADEEIIDVDSKLLMPTFIDLNVYPKSRTLSRKTITTLSQKALLGGYSTLLLMPDTNPVVDSEAIIELIKSVDSDLAVRILPSIKPIFMDSKDLRTKLCDISKLYNAGAHCIVMDSDIEGNLILRITQYAKMLNIPIICFAQNASLSQGVMNEGECASRLGLPAISPKSQTAEIAKICEMLLESEASVVFSAVSHPRSLEIIENYKKLSLCAYAEVSLHHLILDESIYDDYNTSGKINPPLLNKQERLKLLDSLQQGKIDLLTSLQCADFNSKKDQVFELASFGIDALAHTFSLAYSYLVKQGITNLPTLSRLLSKNPAYVLGLNSGSLEVGKQAEFMIVDLDESYVIEENFSPYNMQRVYGKITAIYTQDKLHQERS